ncbi:hypothetical protein ACFWPK_34505 [Nocardia sp. NPDC058519]|uniref:hypothetical protein n=1 Tax=Nocardia sp. NPDC058519 TaxID=3346535 RepID=UPI00364D0442
MSAPRDLVADARTKAVAMRANFQPGAARLLTELADEIEAQRPRVISDPDELGDLPIGSIVLHPDGVAFGKIRARIGGVVAWFPPGSKLMHAAADLLDNGHLTLLHTPAEENHV